MQKYFFSKVCSLIVVLFGVSILTFLLTSWIQGNPAEIAMRRYGLDPTIEDIALMEQMLGIDKSIPEQYISWLSKVMKLDFGNSYITGKPVIEELLYRLPPTASLTVNAFCLMLVIAIPIGVLAAIFHDKLPDYIVSAITFTVMGMPGFVLGMILAYFISVKFQILPMVGNKTPAHSILPVITLALPMSCRYIRIIKSNVLEVLGEDYIFLLHTKGVKETTIMFGHALKNAFIPVVNLMGLSLGTLFGGSIAVETIFSWPGLGSYLIVSIGNRDYPIVLTYVLLMATTFVIINFLVDMLICLLDPRITFDRRYQK